MGRREMREHIFKLLFLGEFNETAEMPEQIQLYFEGLSDLQPTEQAYMENKYTLVKEHLEEIDELLNEKSAGWKTKRMSKVDLNILRLAVYEMKYDEDVPVKVAINEAVEISKSFGGDDSASFVNGILGKIAREDL
ncbi:MAG: transcription antitermination factor NusB [Bacillota bacterium]|nr:transcription antitermination factor NusB [Bacillota bacterium]